MNRKTRITAAPVGQQEPPTRAASPAVKSAPRRARVPPVDYGDGRVTLDPDQEP